MLHDTELGQNPVSAMRRTLGWFVRRMEVDADRLVMQYHELALVENARLRFVPQGGDATWTASLTKELQRGTGIEIDITRAPPRGFGLKTSMAVGQQYWPEVWAMAAAWREQLGDGEAGSGRLPRGRAAQLGQVDWGGGSEGVRRGGAAVAMVH
jgi:hypothetical protein